MIDLPSARLASTALPRRLVPGPIALALLSSLLAPALAAQAPAPFSTLDLGVAVAANVNRERLHEHWRPGHGALLRVGTPFYAGAVALSVQLATFRARGDDQPDFRAVTRAAEWNAVLGAGPARVFAGIQVGAIDMTFLDPATHADNPEENEFLAGGQAGITLPVSRRVSLSLTASHRRIFTRVPIDLTYAAAGLEYRHPTPPWLREVLR